MSNLLVLLTGEYQRLRKYNIITASLVAALIWIGVLFFVEIRDVTRIFPLLIFVDATAMAMVLVGAVMFFEREEGSIRTILVSPVTKQEYCLTKSLTTVSTSVLTLVILYLYAVAFKDIAVNFATLLGGAVLVAFFHSLVGFLLTYYSRDFTRLLMNMMKYSLAFTIPVILEFAGVIRHDVVEKLLYAVPTKASMTLLQASTGAAAAWEIAYSLIYLGVGSALLFVAVMRKFDEFAAREGGV